MLSLVRACCFLLALFVTTPGDRPAMTNSVSTSYRSLPARICVPVKPEAWAALQSGRTRLVLHMQNQAPSHIYSPTFQVSLLDPTATHRSVIDHLSTQPDNAPAAAGALPPPQHFAIDLRAHLPAAIDRTTLCVEVSIDLGETGLAPDDAKTGHPLRISATLEPIG